MELEKIKDCLGKAESQLRFALDYLDYFNEKEKKIYNNIYNKAERIRKFKEKICD